jgi:hypothetical protein
LNLWFEQFHLSTRTERDLAALTKINAAETTPAKQSIQLVGLTA